MSSCWWADSFARAWSASFLIARNGRVGGTPGPQILGTAGSTRSTRCAAGADEPVGEDAASQVAAQLLLDVARDRRFVRVARVGEECLGGDGRRSPGPERASQVIVMTDLSEISNNRTSGLSRNGQNLRLN